MYIIGIRTHSYYSQVCVLLMAHGNRVLNLTVFIIYNLHASEIIHPTAQRSLAHTSVTNNKK